MEKKIDLSAIVLFVFVASFLVKLIVCMQLYPYSVYDEGTVLSSAAFFAGKDWSALTSTSSYYGFGYYGLFFWTFLLGTTPFAIYRIIVVTNAMVQSLYGVIAVVMLYKSFYIKDKLFLSLMGIMASFLVTVRPIIYNETPLILIVWMIAFLLSLLVSNKEDSTNNQFLNTCLLGFVLGWSLTIHTRAIVLYLAVGVVAIVYWIIYKQYLLSVKAVPFVCITGYGAWQLVAYIKGIVWSSGTREGVPNSTVNLGIKNIDFFDWTTWNCFFKTIIGQMSTMSVFTAGAFMFSIIVLFIALFRFCVRKIDRNNELIQRFLVIEGVFAICIFAMIFGQCLSWHYKVYPAIYSHSIGDVYAYKAFSYIRYLGAFCGPFIVCALAIVHKEIIQLSNKVILAISAVMILLVRLWAIYVMPWLENNSYAFEAYIPFSFRKVNEAISIDRYRTVILWMTFFVGFFLISYISKQKRVYYLMIVLVLVFEFTYSGIYNDAVYGEKNSKKSVVIYEIFNELAEDTGVSEKIYVTGTGIDAQRLQFYLYEYAVIPDFIDEAEQDSIIIFGGNINEAQSTVQSRDYCASIYDGVVLLFNNKSYVKVLESKGIKVFSTPEK